MIFLASLVSVLDNDAYVRMQISNLTFDLYSFDHKYNIGRLKYHGLNNHRYYFIVKWQYKYVLINTNQQFDDWMKIIRIELARKIRVSVVVVDLNPSVTHYIDRSSKLPHFPATLCWIWLAIFNLIDRFNLSENKRNWTPCRKGRYLSLNLVKLEFKVTSKTY